MATKKTGASKRPAQSVSNKTSKVVNSAQKAPEKKAPEKKATKTTVKKVVQKSGPAIKTTVKKIASKKAAPKKIDNTQKTTKKVAVKKQAVVSQKNKTVASKSATKSVAKAVSKKMPDNKKTVQKTEIKKSVQNTKNNTAQSQSNFKKYKKNAEKDLAKTKKISKIVTLLADHNNKNKTMQKNTNESLSQKTQTKKQQTVSDKNTTPITSTVEKPSLNKASGVLNKGGVVPSTSAASVLVEIGDPGFLTNDDVFDEADHAQWQQLREQADIQSRAMQLNRPETHPDFDGTHCVECDIDIPLARLKMHKVRCVDCQNELEQERARNQRTSYTSKSSSNGWDD